MNALQTTEDTGFKCLACGEPVRSTSTCIFDAADLSLRDDDITIVFYCNCPDSVLFSSGRVCERCAPDSSLAWHQYTNQMQLEGCRKFRVSEDEDGLLHTTPC